MFNTSSVDQVIRRRYGDYQIGATTQNDQGTELVEIVVGGQVVARLYRVKEKSSS